jgi:5-oxoprolinase (ATP-hydrolysing)
MGRWQFWIDVGGTFTDCVARAPDGRISSCKVLSSGVIKASASRSLDRTRALVEALTPFPDRFFDGYHARLLDRDGRVTAERQVRRFASADGLIEIDPPWDRPIDEGTRLELSAGEPAPVLAVRRLLGLGLHDAVGAVDVRLGTTRATNALLERRGARTAFVTTEGFGDVLRIANQDRPKLFDLNIRKPVPLYEVVVELPERIAADGRVLRPLDRAVVARELSRLKSRGIESLAVCLINAYRSAVHEELVAEEAVKLGFERLSVSSRLSPTIKIVSRGDTTVVDGYLTPVVWDYVQSIADRMPEASIKLMTSAGGLVEKSAFTGKDTVLSGPAGGVVGFSGVARRAGMDKAIGFDMGGTSTDVSRFDGEFIYEYETQKAGVRIVAPMLEIETVAAGGGSICRFDGQKLTVGPQSAGADPGPACYGRGGPLAVTDLNLYLGRLRPEYFPFALDRDAVEARLGALQREIAAATGRRHSTIELAEGLIRIANANMAAAIKKISVSRGCDVREYGLVSFGGAASQHACAVARALGIARVLVHPHSGVLSAWGMGLADVRKFAVRTILADYQAGDGEQLEPLFLEMEAELRGQILDEGIPEGRILEPKRQLDLRYRGQSSTITVSQTGQGTFADEFERLHRQLYGHVFSGRPLEIAAARVEMVGAMDKPPDLQEQEVDSTPRPVTRVEVVFADESRSCAVYRRGDLKPGARLTSPALIIEETSTTVVEPGWECRVTSRSDLLLEDRIGPASREAVSSAVDPIMLEVFNNQFAAIAEQMGVTLQRTALSVNVKERLDFSCAVFTPEGELVANAPHMPVHLGAMSECVKRVIRDVPELSAGDVIATNDPMRGGSHLPDVTVVTPVHDAHGDRILFFAASRAHHAEIGGTRPGSMPPDSRNLAQEGVLIRNLKVVQSGKPRLDALHELLVSAPYPSRAPRENVADISAQIAANQAGVNHLLGVIEHFGLETTQAYMRHIQRAAENKMRASLRRLADRDYDFEDALDDGSPIRVRIGIRADQATVDFAGTGPVLESNLNANRAIVSAAAIYCFRCLIDEEIPLNAGVLAPVSIQLPRCLLNPPEHDDPEQCVAVAGGNVETSQRVVDVLLGALGLAAASQGTMNNVSFGNERFGYYETICGGAGAGPGFDGADAVHTHMTNTRLTDPEILESQYPVRVLRFETRRGSGGTGRHRGGEGVRREIEFLEELELSILSQRRTRRPYGLAGGHPGAPGRNRVFRAGCEAPEELPPIASTRVGPGDRLVIETPGGGGWGGQGRS